MDQTPVMRQYQELKARHADAVLFLRPRGFCDTFFDGAERLPPSWKPF